MDQSYKQINRNSLSPIKKAINYEPTSNNKLNLTVNNEYRTLDHRNNDNDASIISGH